MARLVGMAMCVCLLSPLVTGGMAHAQEAQPSPTPTPTPSGEATPPPVRVSPVTKITAPLAMAPIGSGSAKDAGALAGVRAVQIDDTQARLVIQGVERVVKAGDLIGADIVKSISPGRVVLLRPAAAAGAGGESLVILQFDPQGRTQVLVIASKDTTAKAPRTIK